MTESERIIDFVVAGDMGYQDGVDWQRRIVADMAADPDRAGTILIVEHRPVITCGRSGDGSNLLVPPEELAKAGIEFHPAGRGGDVTYHGPGQWTVYPMLRLSWFERDLHRYLRLLEECVIRFLIGYGVQGGRRPGLTGVWVDGGKLAAVGVAVSRWVTWHGFALNIHPDLSRFTRYMHPCGITAQEGSVASLDGLTGIRHEMDEVLPDLKKAILEVLSLSERKTA